MLINRDEQTIHLICNVFQKEVCIEIDVKIHFRVFYILHQSLNRSLFDLVVGTFIFLQKL